MIREASAADIPIIRSIALATWPVAYHPHILGIEQLEYMLDLLYSEATLSRVMSEGQRFLVMDRKGDYVAFASYTPHYHGTRITHLNKLYVLPQVQGKGAGKELLLRVMGLARATGDSHLELNVNKRNVAISFYENNGFRIDREEVIDIGSGYVMDDFVMTMDL
ncbi:MAG TPA: GNAT family N-acetyltransferase [Flavobacteriales bacterium]|nr:GNAT family N-acetyltransferase [Flavobacteriales bacterium]